MPTTRTLVHDALTHFQDQPDFRKAATNLFKELGYESSRVMRLEPASAAGLINRFSLAADEFDQTKAHTNEWKQFEFLFQFGEAEVKRTAAGNSALELFNQDADRGNKNSFFFHAVRLKGHSYRRSVLADITRQLNRPFGLPTVVLMQHGDTISLGVINRRPNKKDATREVLEKVTLIKDISLEHPHPAHVRILDELRLSEQVKTHKAVNFDKLLVGWQVTLSTSELNKRFYRELANWYFWAVREVRLPEYPGDQGEDVRHATAMIRLITRIIFTWFLKEKHLVPTELFDKGFVYDKLLPQPAKGEVADDEQSTYYKAVLQNLFFATLNTEMRDTEGKPNRRFLPAAGFRNRSEGYGEAGFLRYQDEFSKPGQQRMLDLVNQIPFLNGGLFECLDPTPAKAIQGQPKPERILIDCFSNGNQHLLHVPDKLFFAAAQTLDLSSEYGEKTRKKETVRGLLPLLNRYKFTIAENTPLEEEVALDPELLGKVFENLLAAYNPETQTTARKQTGSFYTPREVVEYMVDESLIAYLRPHLPADPIPAPASTKQSAGSLSPSESGDEANDTPEAALHRLLAAPTVTNPFDSTATWKLIQAIDGLKLLDPACGSGAFPMGALQRLTYLLARLDPNNKLWKQQQLDRAKVDQEAAGRFLDEQLRKQAMAAATRRVAEITNAFNTNNHELDYARKLYLIENCLYGVDIQPVAVQITKLRCFIALLVEQKATAEQASQPEHNLGIRPLPNLETKFVAANTLLRLEEEAPAARRDIGRQANLLSMDEGVDTLRQNLREVRHEYFTVRGRSAKLALRAQDADLRHRLGLALQRSGMPATDARHLADWNPYDLKLAADFFSPKWMLGVDNGFDVVIGNPPYGAKLSIEEKTALLTQYTTLNARTETYVAFIECAVRLLKLGGNLSFIIPDTYLNLDFTLPLRKLLLAATQINEVVTLPSGIFASAVVDSALLFTTKAVKAKNYFVNVKRFDKRASGFEMYLPTKAYQIDAGLWQIENRFILPQPEEVVLLSRILNRTEPLHKFASGISGLKIYQVGKGNPKQTVYVRETKPFTAKDKVSKDWDPLYEGKHIEKYRSTWTGNSWVNYGPWLAEARSLAPFQGEKILVRKIVSDTLLAHYVNEDSYCNTLLFVIKLKQTTAFTYPYCLAILNSKLTAWVIRKTLEIDESDVFPQIMLNNVLDLPIQNPTAKQNQEVTKMVNQILAAKAASTTADTTKLERLVDALVYQLYDLTEAEIALVEGRS